MIVFSSSAGKTLRVIVIRGQGIAGTTLAWQLWKHGCRDFCLTDYEQRKGSSDVAAGIMNPVAGKGWNPGWRIEEFLPEAIEFYQEIGPDFYEPLIIERCVTSARESEKIRRKWEMIQPWIDEEMSHPDRAIRIRGGRLNTRYFLDWSRDFFVQNGVFEIERKPQDNERVVDAGGLSGLLEAGWPHRSAKGQIITVAAPSTLQHMIVKEGRWVVPVGKGQFKVGASYEWDRLDSEPTEDVGLMLMKCAEDMLEVPVELLEHAAGVRPILRKSQPVIGAIPGKSNTYAFNGLGSKGSTYAPRAARMLALHLLEEIPIEEDLDVSAWLSKILDKK